VTSGLGVIPAAATPAAERKKPIKAPRSPRAVPTTAKTSKGSSGGASPRQAKAQKLEETIQGSREAMEVDDHGERVEIEEAEAKRLRVSEGSTSSQAGARNTAASRGPELFRISAPSDDAMGEAEGGNQQQRRNRHENSEKPNESK